MWKVFGNIAQSCNSLSAPTGSPYRDGHEADALREAASRSSFKARERARCRSTVDSRRDNRNIVAQVARSARKRKLLESLDDRSWTSSSLAGEQTA